MSEIVCDCPYSCQEKPYCDIQAIITLTHPQPAWHCQKWKNLYDGRKHISGRMACCDFDCQLLPSPRHW